MFKKCHRITFFVSYSQYFQPRASIYFPSVIIRAYYSTFFFDRGAFLSAYFDSCCPGTALPWPCVQRSPDVPLRHSLRPIDGAHPAAETDARVAVHFCGASRSLSHEGRPKGACRSIRFPPPKKKLIAQQRVKNWKMIATPLKILPLPRIKLFQSKLDTMTKAS